MNSSSLTGSRVLITGASAGIGRAFAVRAVKEGARVLMAARRLEQLEETRAEAGGGDLLAVDLVEPEGCARLTEAVRDTLGQIDLVVSCVGVAPLRMLADTGDEDWRYVFETNVISTHRLLQGCLPLLTRSAMVMALSSETVRQPRTGLGAYASSKAALERMIEGWRAEHPWLRFTTVTVGATFPTDFGNAFEGDLLGRVLTDWGVRGLAQEEFMAPEDVADVLASVAAASVGRPGIGVDHLTLRSPSPVVGTFTEALDPFSTPPVGDLDG
jgi:NAD(P)-dependent dehydrogenase (short-subunit alcohol dehydrogenase family)